MGWQSVTRRYSYSPIITRPSQPWPGGKSLAVYVAIGVEDYRRGDGHAEDLLPGVPQPDLVNESWRDYGNRVGVFRLLDRLSALGVPPTILLNTMTYDTAAAVADAARASGAEIIGHGISNSDSLSEMSPVEERAYLETVAQRIEKEEGSRPGGWSSPWLTHTSHTIDLLAECGYRYLLDLRADDQPVWLTSSSAPVMAIPYALELNDSTSIVGRLVTASDFADMIVDEFDELVAASSRHQPLVMSIVLHSFISGAPFRLRQIARALKHITTHRDLVWLTQPRHVYDAFAEMCPPQFGDRTIGGGDG
jgi:peptidoglycan/xylan/chitin deacetylase (PgdA/CDA1 family)